MSSRRKAREWAMQALFELDLNPVEPRAVVHRICEREGGDAASCTFAEELLCGVVEHKEEIDKIIQGCAEHWDLDRMGRVDRCVMQLAMYEMLHRDDIPAAVSINEAIDIAKVFGTDESSKFVNGILDRARKQLGLPPDHNAEGKDDGKSAG